MTSMRIWRPLLLRLRNVYICSTHPVPKRSSTNHRSVTLSSALQPGRPARPDLGGRSLLCPVFPHQFGTHRCLWQPDLGDSGDSILQFRLADDLVNLILLVAPRQSVTVCAIGHLNTLHRHCGRPVFGGFQQRRGRLGLF